MTSLTGVWAQRTSSHFIFDIKAFRLLTKHPTEPRTLPPHIREELADWPTKNVYYFVAKVGHCQASYSERLGA